MRATDSISELRQDRDDLQANLAALAEGFGKYSDVIDQDSSVRNLRDITNGVMEDTKEMLDGDRLLRLGIVGQVKAGKSSLLNLILFNGEEVLPKAATPMTASLTHIVESDRDEIEIEYYSHDDWEEIKRHAREFERAKADGDQQIPAFVEASHELLAMAKERRIQVEDHLGKTQILAATTSTLNKELRRLVGSEGALTPLVKSVAIYASQGKPDLDIVDTPGINDPIRSRSAQADRLLSQCDAVLLLSYTGQFMDSVDVEFFMGRVPQEGIRHRLVVGSKFDSSLVDVSKDHRGNLEEAREDTQRRLTAHSQEAVARLDEAADSESSEIAVVFVSAMCSILAGKQASEWTPEERHAFDSLQHAYPDWLDHPEGNNQAINEATLYALTELGNQKTIDEHLVKVRENKDGIIADKMTSFLLQKRSQAQEELDELIASLEEKQADLKDGDVEKVTAQQKAVDALEEELNLNVAATWEELVDDRASSLRELREELRKSAKDARGDIAAAVKTVTRYRTERYGFLWLSKRRVPAYEEEVADKQAQEAAIETFKGWLEDEVALRAADMFDRSFAGSATQRVCGVVANELSNELASKINLTAIKRSLREAISRISEEARKAIEDHELAVGQIETGPSDQDDAPEKFVKELVKAGIAWIDFCKKRTDEVAAKAKAELVPATVEQLRTYQEELKKAIQHREFILQRYGLALEELAMHRQKLQGGQSGA